MNRDHLIRVVRHFSDPRIPCAAPLLNISFKSFCCSGSVQLSLESLEKERLDAQDIALEIQHRNQRNQKHNTILKPCLRCLAIWLAYSMHICLLGATIVTTVDVGVCANSTKRSVSQAATGDPIQNPQILHPTE